jgi:hypothetical protein
VKNIFQAFKQVIFQPKYLKDAQRIKNSGYNNIEPADEYELYYWDLNDGWISAGNDTATKSELGFDEMVF